MTAAANPDFSLRRVGAMVLRYWYLYRGSWPRLLEAVYWPTVQMIVWGFLQTFFDQQQGPLAQGTGILIGAVILWDVLFRGQLGLSLSFFEEVWSRNLGHLLVSPLRPMELIAALMSMSLIRTLMGLAPASLLAWWFFDFSVYGEMGLVFVAFFFNLIVMGWAVGLGVAGLVLRYGQGAESLAWALIFAIAPFAGVYYPLSILPEWVQAISQLLPAAHVFEGMRAVLIQHEVRLDLLLRAALLNAVFLAGGLAAFFGFFRIARTRGMLLQLGE